MNFDIISFLSGFVSASFIAFVLYRLRGRISAVRQTVETQAGATRQIFSSSSEARYYGALVKMLNAYHVASDVFDLADIYVEPHFLPTPAPADPTAEHGQGVFHVVPTVHDLPASYAPYNLETLGVNDLGTGEHHLALLGVPGAGKSTALAIIALSAAGEIDLPVIDAMADEYFEQELAKLPPEEQEKQKRLHQEILDRALEQHRSAQKQGEDDDQAPITVDFRQLLPILVHLRDIDLRPEAYGVQTADGKDGKDGKSKKTTPTRTLDPAEPLVRALQRRFGGLTASTLPRLVYNRLTAGTALVLIDGYDDIPPAQRPEKLAWLRRFIDIYQANFIIVSGPVTGYDALVNLGLTPCFLRAWSDTDLDKLVSRWASAWTSTRKGARHRAPALDDKVVRRVGTNNRGRLPIDVTLKAWAAFSGDEKEIGRRGWYDFYARHVLDGDEMIPVAARLAAAVLSSSGEPLTRDAMKAALAGPDGKPIGNVDETINKLVGRPGLLVEWPGGAYEFSHGLLMAFLAAEALDEDTALAASTKPAWGAAMAFAAIRLPFDKIVQQKLDAPPDLLFSSLFEMAPWLVDASSNATWRNGIFQRLTAALLAPSQYPAIRDRVLAALATSRDKGTLFIYLKALGEPSPHVRRLGCIGLGALGDGEGIKDLEPMLTDSDKDVQLAAALALAAIGTDRALELITNGLLHGEQSLKRAVAEALAAIPGVGPATLREAIGSPDVELRRAAVFGLARVKAVWSLAQLYRSQMEDSEWYVRDAAKQAFNKMESPERGGIIRHPDADKLTWLVAWAAERGDGVPAGPSSREVLVRALQDADPERRAAAAQTLADLGHVPALKPLYKSLHDREATVRAAAYGALVSLQDRLGEPLPAVV